jgi:hypothetical protein
MERNNKNQGQDQWDQNKETVQKNETKSSSWKKLTRSSNPEPTWQMEEEKHPN